MNLSSQGLKLTKPDVVQNISMPKRHAPSDADKWDLYNFIDVGFDPFSALVWSNYFKFQYTVAIVLVVVAMGSAEPPARGVFARQQPRGVRPAPPLRFVDSLELCEQLVNVCVWRFQRQQVPPVPAPSYGPPPQVYGPPAEPTTTETPITTTESVEATTTEPQVSFFF